MEKRLEYGGCEVEDEEEDEEEAEEEGEEKTRAGSGCGDAVC